MADIVTKERRSKMMAGIRGKGTKPELLVRQMLTADGFRYRLHRKDLPGTPDVVMPGRKIAIFVHGCFWHQHQGCKFAKLPTSNENFWRHKFDENKRRDLLALAALRDSGWRILTVWECATPINTAPCPVPGGASARLPESSASCGATGTWVGAKQVKNHHAPGPVETGTD